MKPTLLLLPILVQYTCTLCLACSVSRVGHYALKSASPQAFFVAPQRKLRFSKAQLPSLRFKILDATFNHNFYDWIWYGETYFDWLL
jgi:hypothetical protein